MLIHRTLAAAGMAIALLALPACKKKKDDGGPDSGPPGPSGGPSSGGLGLSKLNTAAVQTSRANLKQIGMAFHNYHDANQTLPAGICGPDGKTAGLSWRVQLLPYIEQGNLYKQFKLNEPWDSPHNKSLINMMPRTYAAPGGYAPEGQTYYRAFSGPWTAMPPSAAAGVPGMPLRGLQLRDIQDGTSNTALVAEAAEPVIWTKPDELAFEPKGPLPRVGGVFIDGVHVLLGDGAVYFLPKSMEQQKWRGLMTASGGEVFTFP